MDAPSGTDSRPVTVAPTAEQAAVNAELSEGRGKLTAAELDVQAAIKEKEALDTRIATAEKKAAAQASGVLSSSKSSVVDDKPVAVSTSDFTPDEVDELKKIGIDFSKIKSAALPTTIVGGTAAGIFLSEDAGAATAELARDVAIDTAGEFAVKGLGRVAAGRIPFADLVIPTQLGDSTATSDMRPATQEELVSQVRQREAAKMATQQQEATAEAAMQESDSFLTMQP